MVTTVRREKRFEAKVLQLRVPPGLAQRLRKVAVRSGLDKSALARLALASGLESISRHLPSEPTVEREA